MYAKHASYTLYPHTLTTYTQSDTHKHARAQMMYFKNKNLPTFFTTLSLSGAWSNKVSNASLSEKHSVPLIYWAAVVPVQNKHLLRHIFIWDNSQQNVSIYSLYSKYQVVCILLSCCKLLVTYSLLFTKKHHFQAGFGLPKDSASQKWAKNSIFMHKILNSQTQTAK